MSSSLPCWKGKSPTLTRHTTPSRLTSQTPPLQNVNSNSNNLPSQKPNNQKSLPSQQRSVDSTLQEQKQSRLQTLHSLQHPSHLLSQEHSMASKQELKKRSPLQSTPTAQSPSWQPPPLRPPLM